MKKQWLAPTLAASMVLGLLASRGAVDLGAAMALIPLSTIPVIIFYLTCQKYIIKGVAAGAVNG